MFVMHVFSFPSDYHNRCEKWQSLRPREESKFGKLCFSVLLDEFDFLWLHDHVVSGHARDFVELCTCSSSKQNFKIVKVFRPSSFQEISYS